MAAREDIENDGVGVGEDIMVPVAKHPPPVRGQVGCPAEIPIAPFMLAAIDLDDQPRAPAGKVGDVGTDRILSGEAGLSRERLRHKARSESVMFRRK